MVLSGGSAFGLDSASGVVSYLEGQGIGVRVGPAVVPIVSAAILFDLGLVNAAVRPGPQEGRAACLAASAAPMPQGSVGAGTGATVGKVRGIAWATKGGIGSASITLPNGLVVAAAVAVNAYGGVVDHHSGRVIAGPRREGGGGFHDSVRLLLEDASLREGASLTNTMTNTTIGVVATNATLTREEANFLAQASHDGLALTIRPCHTIRDGDTMFVMATGQDPQRGDITALGAAAVEATAQAVLQAVRTATGLGGVPSIGELNNGQELGRG